MEKKDSIEFCSFAEKVFYRHSRLWKSSTLAVNRCYLRNQIMPYFAKRPVADVTAGEVRQWFSGLSATPATANRALPVLSTIFCEAERMGIRPYDSNPCSRLRRYRSQGRDRILTDAEIRRLGIALGEYRDVDPEIVVFVRLLILTGCRQGEIRRLKWEDYREGNLYLRDSKTGPRTVWLCNASRVVLAELNPTSQWIFPARRRDGYMRTETLYRHWHTIREKAYLPDVRLHDLRHTYASFALSLGETIVTIGRLLGHRDPTTTLRYLHFDDRRAIQAVQSVAPSLGN